MIYFIEPFKACMVSHCFLQSRLMYMLYLYATVISRGTFPLLVQALVDARLSDRAPGPRVSSAPWGDGVDHVERGGDGSVEGEAGTGRGRV